MDLEWCLQAHSDRETPLMKRFWHFLTVVFLFFYLNIATAAPTGSDILKQAGKYEGTANGALYIKYGPNKSKLLILDFQGSKAELETSGNNYRLRFYTTSGKTHGWLGSSGWGLKLVRDTYENKAASDGTAVYSVRKEKGSEYWTLRLNQELKIAGKSSNVYIQTDSSLVLALKTKKTGEASSELSPAAKAKSVEPPREEDIIYQIQVAVSSSPLATEDYSKLSRFGELSTSSSGIQFDTDHHQ
ncbi:MAG: hypothetical protein AAF512_16650, partial [Pseudomonadota bacterium]